MVSEGWEGAVSDRALALVSQPVWVRLFRRRRRRRCRELAEVAARLLEGKQALHDGLGGVVSGTLGLLGVGNAVRAFAGELVSNLPLPADAKIVAAARGVQVTGIVLCLFSGGDLERCRCFIDPALTETKARVRKLLVAAVGDWSALGTFAPRSQRSI